MSKNKTPKRFNSAKEAIKYHEGFKGTAYPDGKTKQGKQLYSIGYGFNDSGAKPNIASRYLEARKSMSQEYADRLLDDYILELRGALSQYLGYERYKGLTEGQLIAFLDTGYQNPAAMKRAATLYKKGDKEGAANALRVEGFEERNEDRRAAFLDKYSPRINNTSLIDPSISIYDALRQAGVRFNTGNPSGYRTKEQHSRFSSGENSWHRHLREDGKTAWALDITPDFSKGATWETLQYELTQNGLPEYFAANGLAILDETDPAIKKRTGATGDHYHIGKDRIAHKKGTYKDWVTKYSGQGNKYNGYTEGASGGYNPYVNYGDQAEQESPDSPRNNDNNKTFYEYIHAQNNGGNTQVSSPKQEENRNIFSDIRKLNAPTQNTEVKNDLFNPTEEDSPYVAEYKETAQKSKNTYDAVKALSHNLNLVNALNNIIEKQEQEAQLEQQSLLPMEWLTNQDSTTAAFGGNLFESGGPKDNGKYTDDFMHQYGLDWTPFSQLYSGDPYYSKIKEHELATSNGKEGTYATNAEGRYVPVSELNKLWSVYTTQLPNQEYGDVLVNAARDVRKKKLDKLADTLSPGAGFFVGLPAAMIGAGIGAASLGSGIVALNAAHPSLFPELITSTIGGEAVNAASQLMGYNSWGDMLKKQWNLPGPEWAWNLTNLGYSASNPVELGIRAGANLVNRGINTAMHPINTHLLAREMNTLSKSAAVNSDFVPLESFNRFKIGDVEVNNPGLNYRQVSPAAGEDFLRMGKVRTTGDFENPMFSQGRLFYGVPSETSSPAQTTPNGALVPRMSSESPSDLLISTANMDIAGVRGQKLSPILNKDGVLRINGETNTRRVPSIEGGANNSNTSLFRYDPTYGYRKVNIEPRTLFTQFNELVDSDSQLVYDVPNQLTNHLQGEEAVKMFKEYGGIPLPEGSINAEQILKYVPEARERYGLVGNTSITDREIAEALYKHVNELGEGTAAVNTQGEPQLLFRGDTARYTELRDAPSPDELLRGNGTMDNSLGTLFLGEYPGTAPDRFDEVGASRYLHGKYLDGADWVHRLSATGYNTPNSGEIGYRMFFTPYAHDRGGHPYIGFIKDASTPKAPNDLNAFIVKTPAVRNMTQEMGVPNFGWDALLETKVKENPTDLLFKAWERRGKPKNLTQYKWNENGESVIDKEGNILPGTEDMHDEGMRVIEAEQYSKILEDAKRLNQGLLKSDAQTIQRDEHRGYNYFALPNFNKLGAKHILPYDLRIPRDWDNPNIYKTILPFGTISTSLYLSDRATQKALGGNLYGWGDFLDSAVQFVKQHPLVQKVKSGINQVIDEVNKEKANREEIGNKVLKTIGKNSIPTITEYLNQQEPHKIPNEFRTNVVNGEVPLTPSNLEFYLATAASTPARQLIKSAYNTSIPYVQKGLQTLGEMLTPSTYLKGFDPVVKGLADVIPIAGLGANSIESIQRVGFNPENAAELTLALSPLASGAKGLRETANAFKDAINNTRWVQTRNLAKSLNQDIIDSNLGFVSPITGTNTIRLRQAPWKAYNAERGSKLTEAEKLGIPRGERKDYHSIEEDKAFKQQIIDFANKWGYDISDIPKGANTKELERYARDLIRKHNSYYRGVELPTLEEDKQLIAKALGSNASADDVLKYVSTHPRPNDVLFMSPGVNAVSYGSNGKVSIISRPYSLSNDRTKWFNDGEFSISTGFNPALGSVNDPWASNIYTYANDYIPSELVSKTPMIFRRFLSPLEINEVPILSRNRYMNLPQYPFRDGGILKKVYGSNANFVNRLKDKNRAFIPDWEDPVRIATHKLSVGQHGNFGGGKL